MEFSERRHLILFVIQILGQTINKALRRIKATDDQLEWNVEETPEFTPKVPKMEKRPEALSPSPVTDDRSVQVTCQCCFTYNNLLNESHLTSRIL